jgi:CDP-6-deoxy-D-xylo-4-hexulose-3-dehydrase
MTLDWPLMENNITAEDIDDLIAFFKKKPILTQSKNVREFEKEWSEWLGVKHSVFVNSGASANLITLSAIRNAYSGGGEIIVPPLGWISDIASVIQNGFKPVFADINPRTLAMDTEAIISKITSRTKAVLLVHAQGFNGLTDRLLDVLENHGIPLIEDVCESHGAIFKGKKCGTFGLVSNFSFYFAHHMSTIEGGMVCTNDDMLYQVLRMLRSHGMLRESTDKNLQKKYIEKHPDLSPHFIFTLPAYNVRNTEIGGVLGRAQLKKLYENNEKRKRNFAMFLDGLDSEKYYTEFDLEGSCNYAFNLVLKNPDMGLRDRVEKMLFENKVEFRRGSSGGGNQLRQPYLKKYVPDGEYKNYPNVEHIHFYGYYIGNYPDLSKAKIKTVCRLLNEL